MDANGDMALIKVPAHYVPTVKMQLLSPQDHACCNEIEIEHTFSGNADFMQLQIAAPDHLPGKRTSAMTVHADICMGARFPFLVGSQHAPPSVKEQFKTCNSTTRLQHALTSAAFQPQSACVSQSP